MLRDRIQRDIREMWQKVASGSLLGIPPDDLAVFEHVRAQVEQARCLGNGKLIELLDRKCSPLVPSSDYIFDTGSRQSDIGTHRSSYWQHARASFFVDEASTEGVLEMGFGPLFGRGFSYAVFHKEGRPEVVQERRWVS